MTYQYRICNTNGNLPTVKDMMTIQVEVCWVVTPCTVVAVAYQLFGGPHWFSDLSYSKRQVNLGTVSVSMPVSLPFGCLLHSINVKGFDHFDNKFFTYIFVYCGKRKQLHLLFRKDN
jgi:hypothetical protein